jgi:general stress protein YciG
MPEIDSYYKLKHASNDWKEFFRECGRKGGKAKSARKTRACRRNGLIAKEKKHKIYGK